MSWGLAILVLLLFVALTGILIDRRSWNRGICPYTDEPWVQVDMDSQGGRLYRSGDHTVWISWPVDRRCVRPSAIDRLGDIVRDDVRDD